MLRRLTFPKIVMALLWGLACAPATLTPAPAVAAGIDDAPGTLERAVQRRDDSIQAYRIGPQNSLQIKIYGDGSTHQIYRVDEQGYIKHALVGRLKLGGYTVEEAESLVEKALDVDYIINPHVTIFVLEYSKFSIIGEVRRPGNFEITGRVSIIEAISMAGGFTAVANQRDVKIIRKTEVGESTIPVDTTRITQRGETSAQAYLEADDVIVVPKSFF